MSFEVIHDAEKDVAALVDAEFGRALGPIATGEKAVELLERFAEAHGVDPATIPTPELESRWKDFVTTLSGDVEDVAGEVHKVADEVLGAGHAGAGAPAAPSEPDKPAEAAPVPDASAEGAAASAAATEAASAEAPSPAGERVMPVTSAKPGFVVCPTCDGWGEVSVDGQVGQCPSCKGLGELAAHEDPQAKEATA